VGDGTPASLTARLRALPAVHALAAALDGPRPAAVAAARWALEERRAQLRAGTDDPAAGEDLVSRAGELLAARERPSLQRVLNASGVIVHTNLGRAPLPVAAREALARVAEGYSNLELDLESGTRGSRQDHVADLLCELTGAEAALVVNNGAAATLLAAAALGGPGRAIAVSRGQLVEIGGSFRIPDVIAASASRLVEVGTTNRTRVADYARAVQEGAAAVLRVHPSNFRTVGFVEEVAIEPLCALGAPVIDDVGSGVLVDGTGPLAEEPSVARSVRAGAALVCCSADKLLGGPQAGLLVGRADAVARARAHPLARAMRVDKLGLAALEATLRLHSDPATARREIPVLAMLAASKEDLDRRAELMAATVGPAGEVVTACARVGGGALPLVELAGPVVRVDPAPLGADDLAARLRAGDPPVLGRIRDGALLLDPRTLTGAEAELAARTVRAALDG